MGNPRTNSRVLGRKACASYSWKGRPARARPPIVIVVRFIGSELFLIFVCVRACAFSLFFRVGVSFVCTLRELSAVPYPYHQSGPRFLAGDSCLREPFGFDSNRGLIGREGRRDRFCRVHRLIAPSYVRASCPCPIPRRVCHHSSRIHCGSYGSEPREGWGGA